MATNRPHLDVVARLARVRVKPRLWHGAVLHRHLALQPPQLLLLLLHPRALGRPQQLVQETALLPLLP